MWGTFTWLISMSLMSCLSGTMGQSLCAHRSLLRALACSDEIWRLLRFFLSWNVLENVVMYLFYSLRKTKQLEQYNSLCKKNLQNVTCLKNSHIGKQHTRCLSRHRCRCQKGVQCLKWVDTTTIFKHVSEYVWAQICQLSVIYCRQKGNRFDDFIITSLIWNSIRGLFSMTLAFWENMTDGPKNLFLWLPYHLNRD